MNMRSKGVVLVGKPAAGANSTEPEHPILLEEERFQPEPIKGPTAVIVMTANKKKDK